jgi:hypothetical protein
VQEHTAAYPPLAYLGQAYALADMAHNASGAHLNDFALTLVVIEDLVDPLSLHEENWSVRVKVRVRVRVRVMVRVRVSSSSATSSSCRYRYRYRCRYRYRYRSLVLPLLQTSDTATGTAIAVAVAVATAVAIAAAVLPCCLPACWDGDGWRAERFEVRFASDRVPPQKSAS